MTTPSPRWAFLEGYDITKNGHPYLSRLRLIATPWFGIYLHHIHTPDRDRDPHDHPWPFASLILSGSYAEHTWPAPPRPAGHTTRTRDRWNLHIMPLNHAHKITAIHGSVWTLVITGRRRGTWRFWTPDGPVDWKNYATADDGSGDP